MYSGLLKYLLENARAPRTNCWVLCTMFSAGRRCSLLPFQRTLSNFVQQKFFFFCVLPFFCCSLIYMWLDGFTIADDNTSATREHTWEWTTTAKKWWWKERKSGSERHVYVCVCLFSASYTQLTWSLLSVCDAFNESLYIFFSFARHFYVPFYLNIFVYLKSLFFSALLSFDFTTNSSGCISESKCVCDDCKRICLNNLWSKMDKNVNCFTK